MSVTDYYVDKAGEITGKVIKKCAQLIVTTVKGVIKGSWIGVSLAVRGVLYLHSCMQEAWENAIEKSKNAKELKKQKEINDTLEFLRLAKFNIEEQKRLKIKDSKQEFSPQEIEATKIMFADLLNNFDEEERQIVFPNGLYRRVLNLLKINALEIEDESELNELRKEWNSFMDEFYEVSERSNAILFALRGEKYIPNHQFSIDEIKDAAKLILNLFRNFERALGCQHQLLDDRVKVEVLRKITTIENNKISTKRKIKE